MVTLLSREPEHLPDMLATNEFEPIQDGLAKSKGNRPVVMMGSKGLCGLANLGQP